jgi:hypothetical protein
VKPQWISIGTTCVVLKGVHFLFLSTKGVEVVWRTPELFFEKITFGAPAYTWY